MSSPTAENRCNDYLSPDGDNSHSTRRRSSSVTPSVRSSVSRITVVEDNPELASTHGADTQDSRTAIAKIYAPRYTWFEHLLGVLCINVTERKNSVIKEEAQSTKPRLVGDEGDTESDSPWILPVYVLSSRKDTNRSNIPKIAKCTIDTGNHQGNIVSRDFVLNVLQLPKENFRPLTREEKKGATSITGHKFTPEAAIYLTWYHKKSIRVFRDMRFLISPQPQYDLIIGARSIRAHGLLDVPNFMAGNEDSNLNKIFVERKRPNPEYSERKAIEDRKYSARTQLNDLKVRKKQEARCGAVSQETTQSLAAAQYSFNDLERRLNEWDANHSYALQNLRAAPSKNKGHILNISLNGIDTSQEEGSQERTFSRLFRRKNRGQ